MEATITSGHNRMPDRFVPLRLLSDERLARLVGDGHDRAFTALYERFHQPLYRYCRSVVSRDLDAQDALQSTLTKALVALREDRRDAPLRPWLFRIAHNESISLLRRRRPEQGLSEAFELPAGSVHEMVDQRDRLARLVEDLRALPERQRGALVMRELSGLFYEEIAAALDISIGAAKQTVLEARRGLMEFSEGREMACEQIQQIVSAGDRRMLRGRRVRGHLRACAACAAFAEAIPQRRKELLALAPPLSATASAGLLHRVLGPGSGSSSGGGGAGLAAATSGKGIGIAVSAKGLIAGAVVVAAALGAGILHHSAASPAAAGSASSGPRNHSSQIHGIAPGSVPGGPGRAGGRAAAKPGGPSSTRGSGAGRPRSGRAGKTSALSASGSAARTGAGAAGGHGGSPAGPAIAGSAVPGSSNSGAGTTSHGNGNGNGNGAANSSRPSFAGSPNGQGGGHGRSSLAPGHSGGSAAGGGTPPGQDPSAGPPGKRLR